jgi:hypothetical protein
MKNLKMFLKVNYYEMNKESNKHIGIGTYNQSKLPQRNKNMQK